MSYVLYLQTGPPAHGEGSVAPRPAHPRHRRPEQQPQPAALHRGRRGELQEEPGLQNARRYSLHSVVVFHSLHIATGGSFLEIEFSSGLGGHWF